MIDLILEVIWITGVALGAICAFLWVTVHTVDGRWIETTGVLVEVGGRPGIRWLTERGELFTQPISGHDPAEEHLTIYYREADPERMRLHARSEAERILRVLTFVLGGVGLLCLAASTVLLVLA
jgi:hypothetical protein